ncbi:helix-turn-helix transcriptional regulator [Paraburkholderia sp. UCT31]|uniref:helix-turn-helix domain-containing protein n=1 Tax=Paraburkholderia sp. UCT31 TaxID=2615209 RepID=UPI00165660F9|nr:helix-turn-helix transcriptional regulator [Paraburkholderia sp. UCT31]
MYSTVTATPTRRNVARRIREVRLTKGLTGRKAGKLAGCGEGHLRRIEAGKVDVRLATLEEIAYALGTDVRTFFRTHGEAPTHPSFAIARVAKNTRRSCIKARMVIAAFEQAVGLATGTLTSMEKIGLDLSVDALDKFCRTLGIEADTLLEPPSAPASRTAVPSNGKNQQPSPMVALPWFKAPRRAPAANGGEKVVS